MQYTVVGAPDSLPRDIYNGILIVLSQVTYLRNCQCKNTDLSLSPSKWEINLPGQRWPPYTCRWRIPMSLELQNPEPKSLYKQTLSPLY